MNVRLFAKRRTTKPILIRWAVFASVMLVAVLGCGGSSQDDMMMRAARRTRDPEIEDGEVPPPGVAAPASVAAPVPAAPVASAPGNIVTTPIASATDSPKPVDAKQAIKPISERKPEKPLSDIDRRKQSLSNIEKISAAILTRYKNGGSLPATWMESSGGIKTLSWRVAILPELGYADLYKQFNVEEPWDGPNNRKLLDLIPDEFVSPERFDTKTNYQLPTFGAYLFAKPGFAFSIDTDAPQNTLMLLEVNDSYAVPWTQPGDYAEARENVKKGLGGLREDGTFAVWANGLPVLVPNGANWQELDNALSATAGDGQRAGQIHRSITIAEVTEPSVAVDATPKTPDMHSPAAPVDPQPVVVRDPVPDHELLAVAGKRLREVFAKKLAEANDDEKKSQLANEMLAESANMAGDGPSAYVMQSAGIKLASQAGKTEVLLRGVDMRVGRFDVDAYEVNMTALTDFGIDNTNRDPANVDGTIYLKRVLPTVYAAIRDDDYVRAAALVRNAYKFSDQPRSEAIPKALNLLRIQLSSAQRSFDTAKESLAAYRIDSSNGDAASTFGRFLVFIKGDWESGLPLLARGGSEEMQELALSDIHGADTLSEMITLGDAWWAMSERAKTGVYRQASRDRATHWYAKAYTNLPESLDKLHVKGRLDEAGDAGKGSPLAIVRDLAEKVNVDLKISLAAIADVGQRKSQLQAIGEDE